MIWGSKHQYNLNPVAESYGFGGLLFAPPLFLRCANDSVTVEVPMWLGPADIEALEA